MRRRINERFVEKLTYNIFTFSTKHLLLKENYTASSNISVYTEFPLSCYMRAFSVILNSIRL